MTDLLLKLFVPNRENTADPAVRARVGTLSGAVGICCNFLLFAGKLLAGILTGSLSITADAMNNLSDASGSVVTLLGFRLAEKPADKHHPYGHARFEYLTGLAVAVMILFIGFELAKSSVGKILNPTAVEFSLLSAAILTASIALKFWMFLFNRRLGREIDSGALLATAADSRNDCITTLVVLAGGLVEQKTGVHCDGILGLVVAVFILYSGLTLVRDTASPLLGENADPELQQKLGDFISSQPGVLGYHDLMVHDYGPGQRFATLHVEMDHREEPLVCHALIDRMERSCLRLFQVHLVIHHDPVVTGDPELEALKEQVQAVLLSFDRRLSLHDFRMLQGKKHLNVFFDVSLPEDLRDWEADISAAVEAALNGPTPGAYHILITYDPPAFNG